MTHFTSQPSDFRKNERGNVLWFILIALVLIGLLTAVLSRSGTSVDQTADVEQLSIKINQALRFAKGVETAVQQMKLRGISESDISFYQDLNGDGDDDTSPEANEFYNPNCTRNDCLVYHVEGGGVTYQSPPSGLNDGSEWFYSGRLRVTNVGTDDASQSAAELLIILPNVTRQACIQFNRLMNIDNPSGNPPKDAANSNPSPGFTGTYTAGNQVNGALTGLYSVCYDGDTSSNTPPEGTYTFYNVLLAR